MNLLRRKGSNHSQVMKLTITRCMSSPLNGSISGVVDIPTLRQVSEMKCGLHYWKEIHTGDSSSQSNAWFHICRIRTLFRY